MRDSPSATNPDRLCPALPPTDGTARDASRSCEAAETKAPGALFNFATGPELRGRELVWLRVCAISKDDVVDRSVIVLQRKTSRQVEGETSDLPRPLWRPRSHWER